MKVGITYTPLNTRFKTFETCAHHEIQYPCQRKIRACAGEKCTADGFAIGTEDCWMDSPIRVGI